MFNSCVCETSKRNNTTIAKMVTGTSARTRLCEHGFILLQLRGQLGILGVQDTGVRPPPGAC